MSEVSEQLRQWLDGNPVHAEECCPDFSCCTKNIAPKEVRERFVKAVKEGDEKTRFEMLGMFLGQAISRAYVAGLEIPDGEH